MTTPVFMWNADLGASLDCKPSVIQSKYGDGYEVRTSMGINSQPKKWTVKFTQYALNVLTFLQTQNASTAFQWTDPLGVLATYVCREWKLTHLGAGVYSVSCDFEQVFES